MRGGHSIRGVFRTRWHGTRVVFLGIRDAGALSASRRDAARPSVRFATKIPRLCRRWSARARRTRGRCMCSCVSRAACQIELSSRKLDSPESTIAARQPASIRHGTRSASRNTRVNRIRARRSRENCRRHRGEMPAESFGERKSFQTRRTSEEFTRCRNQHFVVTTKLCCNSIIWLKYFAQPKCLVAVNKYFVLIIYRILIQYYQIIFNIRGVI